MKVQKMLTLDVEINQKLLKEKNASKLVNEMLIKYYEGIENPYLYMSNEQLEREKRKALILMDAQNKIKEIDGIN